MLIQSATRSAFSAAPMLSPSTLNHISTLQTTNTASTTSLAVAKHLAQPVLDLARVKTRLDGLQSYGVVAALLMNATLRLYASTPKQADKKDKGFENAVKFLFTMSVMFSVISGSYTTIIFSLLGLYSNYALGSGLDQEFIDFFDATKNIRVSGFDSFIVCLVSFKLSFCLSLFLNYKAKLRWFIVAVAIALSWWTWYKWSVIMSLAATLLFSKGG